MALHINPINNFLLMETPWVQDFFPLGRYPRRGGHFLIFLTSTWHSGKAAIRRHSMPAEKVKLICFSCSRHKSNFVWMSFSDVKLGKKAVIKKPRQLKGSCQSNPMNVTEIAVPYLCEWMNNIFFGAIGGCNESHFWIVFMSKWLH